MIEFKDIVQLIFILLVFLIVPYIAGSIFRLKDKYLCGIVIMWGSFQIWAVPMILLRRNFISLVVAWAISMFVVCLIALYKNRGIAENIKRNAAMRMDELKHSDILTAGLLIMFLGLVFVQILMYMMYQHLDEDDARFVVNALEAYENNVMLLNNPATGEYMGIFVGEQTKDVTSPWPLYIAAIAKITMIHPTIIAHFLFPALIVAMTYLVYWKIGLQFFNNDYKAASLFGIIICVVNIFGRLSVYTSHTFLLTRIWQGKAVVAGFLIPLLFYWMHCLWNDPDKKRYYIVVLMSNFSICLLSGMGIIMGIVVTGGIGFVFAILKRRWSIMILSMCVCIPNVIYALIYYVGLS